MRKQLKRGQRVRHHGQSASGFLRRATVSAVTRKRYRAAFEQVTAVAKCQGLRCQTHDELDIALDAFVEHLSMQGEAPVAARYAIYGTAWVKDLPARGVAVLPLAKKALKGFGRLDPEATRDPLPMEALTHYRWRHSGFWPSSSCR